MRVILIAGVLLMALPVSAHSGDTDSQGGHYGSGGYHFHHGYPAHEHYDMDRDGDIDCPYDFDDRTGENSGTGSGGHTATTAGDWYSEGYADGDRAGYYRGYNEAKEKLSAEYELQIEELNKKANIALFCWIAFLGTVILLLIRFVRKKNRELQEHKDQNYELEYMLEKTRASLKEKKREMEALRCRKNKEIDDLRRKLTEKSKVAGSGTSSPGSDGAERVEFATSSAIMGAEYKGGALYITFNGGSKYAYFNVPEQVYKGLIEAKSKGAYFREYICEKYPYGVVHS